ncbi:MAG: InlB B-repeat-containing protein [Endomicrobium sp.]|nr:InlB B-repeat-containing protein [Endomicrobium sp.]
MFIPLAVMIPSAIVASFEFWQKNVISNARNKLVRQVDTSKLKDSLTAAELIPSDISEVDQKKLFETQLISMLPDNFNEVSIVEFGYDMDPGVAMHYDNVRDKIVVNFLLARHLFFDESGKNITNQKLLVTFLKHELAHREFANPRNKVRFFIHNNFTWLEEFLVSFGDVFRPLTFTFQRLNPAEQSIISSYVESSAVVGGVGAVVQLESQALQVKQTEEKREPFVEPKAEQAELEIEPIPIIQEEKIDIDQRVEAFARLVKELPFEMQHSFVKAVLGNDALTARFIRIITTSDETKWKKELSGMEISVKDITDAIKASFTLEQGTMRTTEDGKIMFNLQDVQKSLDNGRNGIISLIVKSMRELDHISYIEAKDFKGFKNRFKSFIHRRLGFLERTQTFIAGLWRFVSLHITTSSTARKFTTEWAGVSVTWIPPYGIDLSDTLQDAHIDDEGKLIEPFVLYGKQRFAGNRRGTITRIVRVTYKNGTQAYLKNFKPGQKLNDEIAAVEISYNFESETCAIHFDMGNIEDGFVSPHPLIAGIRNHDVGNGYHVDGLGNNLPVRRGHNLLGCRYVTMSGKIITISKEGLENGFDIAGEELSGDVSIQLIWEPIVHVVNVEFYDRGDRQELNRGRQQVKVIDGHDARIKGFAPGVIDATANWFKRFFTGLSGNKTGITTHTITWAKLPEGLSWPDNYNTFGLTEDFASSIEEGVTLEMPPMRLGHIMLPNGRIGTVRCKVIDTVANQEIIDFQMGKTPVDRDLRIEYEFTPDKAEYSLNFEANGGTLGDQPEIEVTSEGQAVIPKNTALPTRTGYIFKGYQIVKCSHISLFNISITDQYNYMTITPDQLQTGITLGGIVGDLVLVAQWEKEEAPAIQEQVAVQQEQTQATQSNLLFRALKFVFIDFLLLKVLVPFIRTVLNAAIGKYGRVLQIVAWVCIVGAIIWLVNKLIMHPTATMLKIAKFFIKFYIVFAGFGYLNNLEKVLFITSLATVFFILPVLTTFIASPYLLLIFFLSASFIAYSEFKMKINWWNWAKRTFGKVFKFIFLASGKTFRKSVQIAKIAAGEPIKYAINLYDNMSNIADNLSEIPVREGYEFGGLKILNTDKVFTVEDMKSDFVVPHEFFDGTNTIEFEYVWLTQMKASFLPGTTAEVQNMPQEITEGVLRGKKFEFPGFRESGIFNAAWGYSKYLVPSRAGYDFDGLVIKIVNHEDIIIDRDKAMAGFEISEDLMTGPVSFEIKWKAKEGTVEEEEVAAQPEAPAPQQEPKVEQAEETAQPILEEREEEIGQIVLPEEIETFAKLVRELPFDIQYRFIVAVFGINNMPLVAKFIGSISTPTEAWRRNLFKQQADREKISELLKQRSGALQPMAATEDGRIILNLDQIRDLLEKSSRQGIRSLIVQATSELDRLPYMDASRAIREAQEAAENAEKTAKRAAAAKEVADRADYEAKTSKDPKKADEAQAAAQAAEKAKAKAEAAERIAKETAEAVTRSTKIRAFIHNNLRFLETFIIFISSVFVRMTLTVKTSAIARKFTTEWGDVSVTWIPPEGLELEDSDATATIDEEGRLIEPAVIYGKQKLAGNRRGTVQRIVRITDKYGNLKYLDNFQTGDILPDGTKAVEVFYNFIPDTCKIRLDMGVLDMGVIDAQDRFESRSLVKDHEVGMGYHVDGFGEDLPVRTGYKLLGCRYTTMNGQIVYIPLKLLKKGFDITGQELSGDLNIQLIWEPNVNDVKVQFFDGEVKQALEGNIKVVQGHGARVKGLAPNTLAAFAGWIRRIGTGLAARQSGVKMHKVSWAKLPPGLDCPDNYQTDGLNEDFISNIEDDVVLEEPPMRTGRIMLVDGRVATVVCEVRNANTGQLIPNFQFGRTLVKGNLKIQYKIIEEEEYSLHFEANGGTLDDHPPIVNYNRKRNEASVRASNIPTRAGYVFKGYKAIKCTHQTVLGVRLGDDRYETKNIEPKDVASGFIIENVFGEVVLVAQWEKVQTLVTREQRPVSKGFILQVLTSVWAVVKGGWAKLSTRQQITFVFAGIILLAAGTMSLLLTYGIIAISFSFFISIGLYIIGGLASLILVRLIYVMIKGFLLDMLKAIGNFLIKSFKLIVLAGGKTLRRSYRVTRQVFRAPINYAKNFYENMTNIADNLSGIPTKEGYEFGGFSVTNYTETAEFSVEEIKRDFIVPGKYFSQTEQGEHIVKLNYIWLPKVTITTGDGTNLDKNKRSVELSSREVNLAEYKDLLVPPEGYGYTTLYWTCDAYPDRKFEASDVVKLDKPCTFTPHWEPLPTVKISVGNGAWKGAAEGDATRERFVAVTATWQGAMLNLRKLRDELEAPDDCDPDSLYFTEGDKLIEEDETGQVLIKSNVVYTPHWKPLAGSNKARLFIGEGKSIIITADPGGFINLDDVIRKYDLKPKDNKMYSNIPYWTANGDSNLRLRRKVKINSISVLALHWEISRDRVTNEGADILGKDWKNENLVYSITYDLGLNDDDIDDVSANLDSNLRTFFRDTKLDSWLGDFSFPGVDGKDGYKIPTRHGYRFKGFRLQAGSFEKFYGTKAFKVNAADIKGPIKMTMLWEKEYSVISSDPDLSAVLENLKAYEGNNFEFPGFNNGMFHYSGYKMPTRPGFKFRGVMVRVGDNPPQEHLGVEAFTIKKEHITGPITMTVLWDDKVSVDSDDETLSDVFKGLDVYKNNKFSFKFNSSNTPTKEGYRFKGVKVKIGNYEDIFGTSGFTIHGEKITGPVTITALWEKEYPLTSSDEELSAVLGDLKAYQDNDFEFKGFKSGVLGMGAGYPVPTKAGFKFRGVEVKVGNNPPEKHLGLDGFTISKQLITGDITITMTALWDEEVPVTPSQDLGIGDIKAYKNNDFSFKGFGKAILSAYYGYDIPKKAGFRFKGVEVKVGNYVELHNFESFTIPGEKITGPIAITAVWEKEYPVTSSDPDLSAVLGNLKAYEGNNFEFPGFGTTYPIPKKTGFKFKGVRVQVGTFDKEFGTDPFTIPKGNIADTITMTAVWEPHSPITFTKEDIDEMPEVPKDEFYYKGDKFHFRGFYTAFFAAQMGRYGYTPTKPGYKFLGVSVQNGNELTEQHLGNDPFDIDVKGPITITYLWEKASPITVDFGNGETQELGDIIKFKGDTYNLPGVGKGNILMMGMTNGLPLPERPGYKFKGVFVENNGVKTYHESNAAFDIPVNGAIKITYDWEEASPITFNTDNGGTAPTLPKNEFYYKDDTFHFKGFGGWTGYTEPKREGFKFKGVKVSNNGTDTDYLGDVANAGFDIDVQGPISITYLWEQASPITFNTDNGGVTPTLPENEFYYKGSNFHFKGFYTGLVQKDRYGYTPTKPGYKFLGVEVNNGGNISQHLGAEPFDITVNGPIKITYLWAEDYHVTLGDEPLSNVVLHEGDKYHFVGFGGWTGYTEPKREGFKFLGVSVQNGNQPPEQHLGNAAFDIDVKGPITITYLWEQEAAPKKKSWWKSEESAQGAAQAAAEIGMLLGTQVAGSMFVANGPLKLMKSAMDSFAELERSQVEQIGEAQTLVSQNNYFKGNANEEILRQLLSNSELSPEDASMFLKFLSDVEIETSGEVMSYEPNTQDPSKPGKMHVNYKMLRAMFLDASGKTKNIELFKVFVKHELTHMEFAASNNPLYKAAHNIPFLEEFLVSFSDLYVWQQAQLILPEYTNVVKFVFTNARILSIAAGISIEEAEKISKLYTGLPQREMAIALLPTVQGELSGGSTSAQSTLRPLSLFVANASDGSLTPASSYADKFGGSASDYATAVVEHIPSTVLVPTGYSKRISVNVSFNDLAYDVYVRQNAQGKCFIGLKLKGGADLKQNPTIAAQNFAAAVQYFANDLNTNTVLREELNRATNLGISSEGVAMMDFVGFPPALQTSQQLTQQLYESGDVSQGLVGVYTAWDLEIGEENLTTIEEEIRSHQIFKLNTHEKFYSLDLKTARLSNSEFIREAASIKKKEGATTIILNITDFDFETINSASLQENLKEIASIIRSLGLRPIIQVSINKTADYENLFRILMGLGFEGISLEADEIENIENIKAILEMLEQVCGENNITTERNTIHLKNKAIKDALGDLTKYNVLAIVSIDEETHAANIDEGAQLKAKDKGYLRGRRILEQKIDTGARNVRALLKLVLKNSSSVTPLEIKEATAQAGLTDAAVKKHIELLCARASSDQATAVNDVSVMEALGFLRGFIESYALSQYLQAFDLSPKIFNMNTASDKQSLTIILTAALIIDSENQLFKSPSALKEFIEQAKTTFEQAQELSSETLADLRKQMIMFANSIYKQMDEERDIDSIIRTADMDNPYRKLYIYLAIANDLINTVSFRKVVEETGNRAKAPISAVKNILGAA